MDKLTTELELTAPKKHSVRYDTSNPSSPTTTIYIKKSSLPPVPPPRITLTIEF